MHFKMMSEIALGNSGFTSQGGLGLSLIMASRRVLVLIDWKGATRVKARKE